MIKTYFGRFKNGRLHRLSYLSYAVLLGVILSGFVLVSVLAIVGVEKAIGGNVMETQQLVAKYLGLPFLISLVILVIALFIAGINITAKRARDIGLPGWIFVPVCIITSALIFGLVSLEASQVFTAFILAGLLLAPGNTFKRQQE